MTAHRFVTKEDPSPFTSSCSPAYVDYVCEVCGTRVRGLPVYGVTPRDMVGIVPDCDLYVVSAVMES